MKLLSHVDGDEVSLVKRAANRRRFLLLKGDSDLDPELSDILEVPWEREGALLDELRKDGITDETVEKAVIAAVRLLKGVESEFSPELIEKLGREMYPVENKPLNLADSSADDAEDNASDNDADDGKKRKTAKSFFKKEKKEEVESSAEEVVPAASNNEEGGTVEFQVPVKKEDGTWDFSGVPEDSRPFFADMVEKAEKAEKLETRLEETREALSKSEERLREKEYIAKADEYKVLAPADKLGLVLKEAADKMDPDRFAELETVLQSAAQRVETGDLFTELGTRALEDGSVTKSDPWSKIEALAAGVIEKSTDITKEQAINRVLQSDEGRALYAEYERHYLPAAAASAGFGG